MDLKLTFCCLVAVTASAYASDGFFFPDQISSNAQAQANSNAYSDNSGNSHATANSNAVSNSQNNRYPGFYKPTSHDFPVPPQDGGFHPVDGYPHPNRPENFDYNGGLPSYDPYPNSGHIVPSGQGIRPGYGGGNSQANANSKSETSNGSSLSNAVASSQSTDPNGASAAAAAAAASAGTSFVNGVPVATAAAAASAAVASQHGGSAASSSTSSAAGSHGSAFSGGPGGQPQYQRPQHLGREFPERPLPQYANSFGNNGPFYAEPQRPWQFRSGDQDDDDDDRSFSSDAGVIHAESSRARSLKFPFEGPSITISKA
ncbi:hypothetical protein QAD02_019657 [Eretmocerus hayati]|uniref:Uncharacterized protein n=1 Tax=Eretmocerus hayati TaxID=131215 RepID=A0ACC2PQ12_9HYME|nr:hypothetical protein QAD02_019657 [Eretmocerus hayati]